MQSRPRGEAMTAAFTAGYEAGKKEGYDKGFAEGVDWATPRIWNEAVEAAAELAKQSQGRLTSGAIAAAIRKLKKP